MRKSKFISMLLGLTLLLSVSSCASSSDSTGTSSSSEIASTSAASESASSDEELTQLDVVLDWYPNAIHTFLYYAVENGYFAEEGLEVNIITPADSVDALTFVASGKADIGFTYPVEIVQSVESEMPILALASVCALPIDCMVSLASNTEITSDMSTLAGKIVGYDGSSATEAVIRTIARGAGVEDDEYELLNVGFDLSTSLTTGNVDIVAGIFENDEVVTMQLAGYELNVYYGTDYGFPEMYALVMAVNEDEYTADPATYEGFLRACEKGFEDMEVDEDAALELMMSAMNSDDNPLDEEQQRLSYRILMEKMETEDEPFLSMSTEKWQTIIDWMLESELIETQIDAEDVMVQQD